MINVYIQKWNKENTPWQSILSEILKNDYHIENMQIILRDEFGKPYFQNGKLEFNVSHSGEYLVIAVSESAVGVDIQGPKSIKDGMYLKVVQPKEQSFIGENREKDFLRLWTLKESFVKAEGKGFRIPLTDYWFEKKEDQYFVNYGGQRGSWTFNIEETLIDGYFISVCGLDDNVQWKMI